MEQRSNALRVQPPRFQLPRTLQEGFSPNEVIHSFCNILFESWIHPNTREYSYHIISLDNFGRIFHRSWNSLTKFNHPPRIVQTFTLALEKDMFIVLKYSAGYKVERFLVLTQPLIKFIADLHKKQTEKRNDNSMNINNKEIQLPSLIVKINRKSLPKQFIDNIENSYGITYGPSLQQLFECYLLPEMEKPYMLLGHALTLNAIKDLVTEYQIDAVRQNLMYSKFVRASDVEPSSETESEESETDQEIESLKKVQTQTTTLPATNTPIQTPQTQNVDRMSSPFEADVPSSINRKQSLSKWSDEYCQESANLGREDARLPNKEQNKQEPKNNEVEKNRMNKRHQIIEKVPKPLQPDVRENLNEHDEDIVDMGPLDLCCGLDSRYCRCYRLKGYIPRTLNYELVCIKFSSLSTDSWRVTFEKYSYDSAYDDLYKTGNIMRSRDAGNNAVQMSLADAVEQYGEEILNNKYMAAIPCKLFRMWQQNELQADNDAKFLMVRLGDKNHLSKLGILDTAAVVFRQNEFQRILSQFTTFFACSEGDDNALEKRSEGEPDYEEDIRSVEVIIEPDLPDFITDSEEQTMESRVSEPTLRNYEVRNSQIKTKSIGIQVELSDIPFSIDCIAEIHCDLNMLAVTGDDIFKHGFDVWLQADYLTRAAYFHNGRKLETEKYVIHFLKDRSVSILLKEYSEEDKNSPNNKSLNGVENLVTDSLEWNIEMMGPGPVPFYFKKLKPAYITTENDFPSTLVAKKRIGNLISEVNGMIKHSGKRPIPVLWNSTKTLELSTVHYHSASKKLYLLFERNLHNKYSLDAIYFPDSASSKKIYNTKYGTFDTLQMETQQTAKVIVKISDFPKPLLIIISDAFVLNNGLIRECEALYHFECGDEVENKLKTSADDPKNPGISKRLVVNRARNGRRSAIKPPNFYNENAIQLRLNNIVNNYIELPYESNNNPTREAIEQAMMDLSLSSDDEESRLVINEFVDEQNSEVVTEQHEENVNVTSTTENSNELLDQNEKDKQEKRKEEMCIRSSSTLVKNSLPLQKKYSITQEWGREIRRNTDKMFLQRDISRIQPIRDLNVTLSNNRIKLLRGSSAKSEGSNQRPESSIEYRRQLEISNETGTKCFKRTTSKYSNLTQTGKGNLNYSSEPQDRSRDYQLLSACQRTQILNSDLLTSARINEDDYNHNLGKVKSRYHMTSESSKFLQLEQNSSLQTWATVSGSNTIISMEKVSREKENIEIASSTENSYKQPNHNVEDSIPAHTIPKVVNHLGCAESSSRRPLSVSNKKYTIKSTTMSANEGNHTEVNDTIADRDSGELAKDTDLNKVNDTALDLSTTLTKEKDLELLSLPQLMLTYPKPLPESQTKSKDISDMRKNDDKRHIYKKVLKAKIRENLLQHEPDVDIVQSSNDINALEVDSDISVDIKVTLNELNGSTELLTSSPIVRRKKDNVPVISNCTEREFLMEPRNTEEVLNGPTSHKKRRKNSDFEARKKAASSRTEYNAVSIRGRSFHAYSSGNNGCEENARRISNSNYNERIENIQAPHLPLHFEPEKSMERVAQSSSFRSPDVPVPSAEGNSSEFPLHNINPAQSVGDRSPFFIFSPHSPFAQSPNEQFTQRVDEFGNSVSADLRSSSTYRHQYSTNMHNSSFVPTVPNFFHIRGPPRMMMPPQQHSQYNHIENSINNQHMRLPAPHSMPILNNVLTNFQADPSHPYRNSIIENARPARRKCSTHLGQYAPLIPPWITGLNASYPRTHRPTPIRSGTIPPLMQNTSSYLANQYQVSNGGVYGGFPAPHPMHIRPFAPEMVPPALRMNPIMQASPFNTRISQDHNADHIRQIENEIYRNNLDYARLLQLNCSSHYTGNYFSGF